MNLKLTKSIKTILNFQTIGISLIFMISLFFFSAPFLNMLVSNETNSTYQEAKKKFKLDQISKQEYELIRKKYTYFGYSSKRRMWFAIGLPLLLLYISSLLLYCSTKIENDFIKKIIGLISFFSTLISFYLLIWALWYRADFPKNWYYIAIGFLSIASVMIVKHSFSFIESIKEKKRKETLANENFINKGFEIIDLFNEKYTN